MYGANVQNEEVFRDDYELWKDKLRKYFNKQDYKALFRQLKPGDILLFAIAGAANLTPENDEKTGFRLHAKGNMIEWMFACLTDKLKELRDGPSPERHDELTHWLATFDYINIGGIHDVRATNRLGKTMQNFNRKRKSYGKRVQ